MDRKQNEAKSLPINLFMGLRFFSASKQKLLTFLETHLLESPGKTLFIATPNPEQMVLAKQNPEFHSHLAAADILLPDGAGLVWAMHRQVKTTRNTTVSRNLKKIAGREVFHDLLEMAARKNWKVFLLGGSKGSAQTVIRKWNDNRKQSLPWAYDKGALNIRQESEEEKTRVLEKIHSFKPEVLFVAYGAPWQEKWIVENRAELQRAGVKVAMVVGGAFEYEAGLVPPVLPIVEKLNLEWLQRLVIQPWRWKRQVKGLQFFWWVMRNSL